MSSMKITLPLIALLTAAVSWNEPLAIAAPAADPEALAATTVAERWLSLLDAKKYDESWKESAAVLRAHVTQLDWKKSMELNRTALGPMTHRELSQRQVVTSLPGAPDGKYVVLQFKASFQNKKDAVETVTPQLDKDGKWRVSGYFIK